VNYTAQNLFQHFCARRIVSYSTIWVELRELDTRFDKTSTYQEPAVNGRSFWIYRFLNCRVASEPRTFKLGVCKKK